MSMTIRQALAKADLLTGISDTPRLDAELLLSQAIKCDKTHLYAWPDKPLQPGHLKRYEQLLDRRAIGEPMAYILGQKEFWSLPIKVNSSTLIPRPETECLVEKALQLLTVGSNLRVLDLGTGTGAIALAIASERPLVEVTGCDIEPQAVALAKANKAALAIDNVRFILSDWCLALSQPVDMIISNPPYIDPEDPHLEQGDVRFEPRTALVALNGGLADIQSIATQSVELLKPQGWLLLEHGFTQGKAVREILRSAGFENIGTNPDLAGHERITYGQKSR
jgi:release factor glutamine methyltransferase